MTYTLRTLAKELNAAGFAFTRMAPEPGSDPGYELGNVVLQVTPDGYYVNLNLLLTPEGVYIDGAHRTTLAAVIKDVRAAQARTGRYAV